MEVLQRNGLLGCCPSRRKGLRVDDDVCGKTGDLANAINEIGDVERGRSLARSDEKVNITVESVITPGDRTEYPDVAQIPPGSLLTDLCVATFQGDVGPIVRGLQHALEHVRIDTQHTRFHLGNDALGEVSSTSELSLGDIKIEPRFADESAGVVRAETSHTNEYSLVKR